VKRVTIVDTPKISSSRTCNHSLVKFASVTHIKACLPGCQFL